MILLVPLSHDSNEPLSSHKSRNSESVVIFFSALIDFSITLALGTYPWLDTHSFASLYRRPTDSCAAAEMIAAAAIASSVFHVVWSSDSATLLIVSSMNAGPSMLDWSSYSQSRALSLPKGPVLQAPIILPLLVLELQL